MFQNDFGTTRIRPTMKKMIKYFVTQIFLDLKTLNYHINKAKNKHGVI